MGLFDPIVAKPDPMFEIVRTLDNKEIARRTMEDVFSRFTDPDGNFVEQFQTTGFNARVFELYLHAAFTEQGMQIQRPSAPDFILQSRGTRFGLEATTSNPATSGPLVEHGKALEELEGAELRAYMKDELPIRMGGPLFTKLNKRYWEQRDCRGLPLVVAIQAFHDKEALFLSHTALEQYLYGRRVVAPRIKNGQLIGDLVPQWNHQVGPKRIPSGFFYQPDAEHISAVIFSNSGTVGKFTRMGYPRFATASTAGVVRSGNCMNFHPEIRSANWFAYDLRAPTFEETWCDGLVVMHNPNAKNPLPDDAFQNVAQVWEDREVLPSYFVFSSRTWWSDATEPPLPAINVEAIPSDEGRVLTGRDLGETVNSDYWFADSCRRVLGAVVQSTDKPDVWEAWKMLKHGDRFYPHESRTFADLEQAAAYMQEWLAYLVFCDDASRRSPMWLPRLFPQVFLELKARYDSEHEV